MRHSNRWLRGESGGCHLLMLLLKVVFIFFPRFCEALGEEEPRLRRCARGMGTVAVAEGTAVARELLAALGV